LFIIGNDIILVTVIILKRALTSASSDLRGESKLTFFVHNHNAPLGIYNPPLPPARGHLDHQIISICFHCSPAL
jgi:hypothetical protein